MAARYNQILIQYRDKNGREGTGFWSSQDQEPGGASYYGTLASNVQACCDAAVLSVQFQTTLQLGNEPTSGPYDTVADRCGIMSSFPIEGTSWSFQLMGPKAGIFLPDNETLDLGNDDVIALQSSMVSLVGSHNGNPMGPFKYGRRTFVRGLR